MWLHTASIKSTVENETRLFPSPFHVSTSSRLTLAREFRSYYVAAFSTALRSATEGNESGGHVAVPCPSKVKHRSSTADWLKSDVTRLVTTEHIRNKYSLLKSSSVIIVKLLKTC